MGRSDLGWNIGIDITDDRYDDDYDWDSSFFYFDVAAGLYYRFSENIAFRGELGALGPKAGLSFFF